ncbi:MAG TPA: TlyA family RNA methyltransferase [Methylomirabilota bacterium]|nr:TlyA family RNA methyltransferase [Methylomirabilota bacterium]
MSPKQNRKRLDLLLVERGLAESRHKAQAMILAGEVAVNGLPGAKAAQLVADDARLQVRSRLQKYASRAGLKLEGALEDFAVSPAALVCLDAGASTGGFTDCLLQHGAKRVYAVDVTVNQLAWKLQQDPRVVRIERNARELSGKDVPERVDLAVVDVSFISVTKVLAAVASVAGPAADFLILIKPQFELSRRQVGRGGIVRDERLHEEAVQRVSRAAEAAGFTILGVRPSRLPGAEGNREFFLHARRRAVE